MLLFLLFSFAFSGAQEYTLFTDFSFGTAVMKSEIPEYSYEFLPNQIRDTDPSSMVTGVKIGVEVFRDLGFYFQYENWNSEFEYESSIMFGSGASIDMQLVGGGIRLLVPAAEHWSFMAGAGAGAYSGTVKRILGNPPDPVPMGSESGIWDFSNTGLNLSGGFVYRGTRNGSTLLAGIEAGFHVVDIHLQDDETHETNSSYTTVIPELKACIGFGFRL
jgi:hypothetical protein